MLKDELFQISQLQGECYNEKASKKRSANLKQPTSTTYVADKKKYQKEMELVRNDPEVTYNPSALLNIFSSTLNNETTRKVFKVKGIYTPGS